MHSITVKTANTLKIKDMAKCKGRYNIWMDNQQGYNLYQPMAVVSGQITKIKS